ncbi:MAG: LuxR C-terminal-related transcriptional regulator [Candidatus Promineifilaceae bacterium]|nr:LuxR C-terminal-related transcriptional regulator [Candidatus Promineifilaceae bacterium]
MKSSLLATKLHQPPRPAKWVPRPYLSQHLTEGLNLKRKMTLVSAPAGFGKTSCICAWINTLDFPVAWLSLETADDDPLRFFTYFVAALQTVFPIYGREIEGVLQAGQLPPEDLISASIINDLLELGAYTLLILDDFHVIQDPFILRVLGTLIANLPSQLHLVLITREDPPLPLSRLRANNLMTEIRARDLRFSRGDMGSFLKAQGVSLSQVNIDVLEDKTEGWIAGLQLAAIALQPIWRAGKESDLSGFIANLSGSNRLIVSYLTEQVLNHQPEDVRRFLLETAMLDRLNGDLCNAVTGRSDGRFLLEQLYNANLFLIPLDDDRRWYRYHHLFADLLRDHQYNLLGEETAILHQRASHWYAQADMPGEAIAHALAAADYEHAVELIECHAMDFIMRGYVNTMNGWVQAVPEQWQSRSPRTNLAIVWMHLLRGDYAGASPYLERLRVTLANTAESPLGEADASLHADWLVIQSLLLYKEGNAVESMATAEKALSLVAEENARVRSFAYYALASACQVRAEYDRALESYQLAIELACVSQNLVAEMLSVNGLAQMAFEQGRLHLAFEIAAPVVERLEQSESLPPISAIAYGLLGEVCLQWNQLEQARHYIQRSLQLSMLGGYNTAVIFGHVALSRLAQIEGDLATAARELQTASEMLPAELPEYVQQEVIAQEVNLSLVRNRPAAAEMMLEREGFNFQDPFTFPSLPSEQNLSHSLGLLYNSSLRLLIYLIRNGRSLLDLEQGLALANQIIAAAHQGQQIPVALQTYLLRAQMYAVLGDMQASQADYLSALELAEAEGFIAVFIEEGFPVAKDLTRLVQNNQLQPPLSNNVGSILAAITANQLPEAVHEVSSLIEPLSDREVEVLQLIAEGLTYKQIADRLFISLNTVRYHVKALYGKLNVNNRTQAIAMARRHQIL